MSLLILIHTYPAPHQKILFKGRVDSKVSFILIIR